MIRSNAHPSLIALLAAATLSAGCFLTNDEVYDKVEETPDASGTEETSGIVDAMSPAQGTAAGGQEITIELSIDLEAGDEVSVTFDGEDVQVVSASGSTIVVRSPPMEADSDVQVEVNAAGDDGGARFHAWQDGQGMAGALGSVAWVHYVGDYWTDAEDYGFATVGFTKPTDIQHWQLYSDQMDSCSLDYSASASVKYYSPGAEVLELVPRSGDPLELSNDGSDTYGAELGNGQYTPGTVYAVQDIDGDSPWSSLSFEDLVPTPQRFTISSPEVDGASVPDVSKANFRLQWTDSGSGDYVIALMYRYQDGAVVDEVTCALEDDGTFTVPSSTWSDWSPGDQVTIVLGRAERSATPMPHNLSNSEVAGLYFAIGAAWQQ